jgi:uncharacterized protein YjbI with pentapeptide repeats
METHIRCSYEGCEYPAWIPRNLLFSRQRSYCLFHTPLTHGKRLPFIAAWEKLLNEARQANGSSGALTCRGFIFPMAVDISGYTLEGEADFHGAVFTENVNFSRTSFCGCDFTGARFSGGAPFREAVFRGAARFTGAQFLRNSEFQKSRFLREVAFNHSVFRKHADFTGTLFDSANFHATRFLETVEFTDAVFSGEADFSMVKFGGNAFFNDTVFAGRTVFEEARFTHFGFFSDVSLSGAQVSFM